MLTVEALPARFYRDLLCAVLVVFALLSGVSSVAAQEVPAGSPLTLPRDAEFDSPLGTYHYRVKWEGAKIAKAAVTVAREGDLFVVTVHARTRKLMDKVYRLRYRGEGQISAEDLAPVATHMVERSRKGRKETTIVFREDGSVESVRITERKGKEPKRRERELWGFVLDPISAVFIARRLEWEVWEAESFEVFTGKHRYLVRLNC